MAHRGRKSSYTRNRTSATSHRAAASMDALTTRLNEIEGNGESVAVTTIITTRGIGFSVSQFLQTCLFMNNRQLTVDTRPYPLYRMGLAALETRIFEVRKKQKLPTQHTDELMNIKVDLERRNMIKRFVPSPNGLFRIIESVGAFQHGNEYYVPGLARNEYKMFNQCEKFIPSSEHVCLSNLRHTVEALADPDVPQEVRQEFYKNNPIPGCIWGGAPGNPVLQNGNDIMPPEYNNKELHEDMMNVEGLLSIAKCKFPQMLSDRFLPSEHYGSASLLVSNSQGSLRQPDLVDKNQTERYFRSCHLEGDIDEYWSSRRISVSEALEGAYNLTGELPVLPDIVCPIYCGRNKNLAAMCFDINYEAVRSKRVLEMREAYVGTDSDSD